MQRWTLMVVLMSILVLVGAMSPANAQTPDSNPELAVLNTGPEYTHRQVVVDHEVIDLTELEAQLPALLKELGISAEKDTIIFPTPDAKAEYALSLRYLVKKAREWKKAKLARSDLAERALIWQHNRWHENGTTPFNGWRHARYQIEVLDAALAGNSGDSSPPSSTTYPGTSKTPLVLALFLLIGFVLICGRRGPIHAT